MISKIIRLNEWETSYSPRTWRAVSNFHLPVTDTDTRTGDQVHRGDEYTGNRVALYEFHGAVHRAVKLTFALQRTAARLRLFGSQRSGS